MSARKINALELKIHQAALADPSKTLSQKEVDELAPDVVARRDAVNFLLGTGMLKMLKDPKGRMQYRAVLKKELEIKKDMSGEEAMVLSHIQAAANEGIWTKHLKARTELHQTVIDRCLKSLVSKKLIKAEKSIEHPTRKMYMLYHLEPSVKMTGGPWYTDNELDTEFIKLLSSACLHYIKDRSFPKKRPPPGAPHAHVLYPLSAAPAYPSAQQIQLFLGKSKITETPLTVEHVEMLLNVLVLDGEIEKVPAFGAAMWESADLEDGAEESEEEARAREREKGKKRKKAEKEKEGKKKRRRAEVSDDSDSDASDARPKKKKVAKRRKKESDAESASEEESGAEERAKRKRRREAEESDDSPRKGRKKKKAKPASSSASESESDDDAPRRKAKRERAASPVGLGDDADAFASAYVFRAVRQERVALGWSQAPCGRCPVFDFCKERGPVNPTECSYYEEWLKNGVVAAE